MSESPSPFLTSFKVEGQPNQFKMNQIKILFWLYKSKANKEGKAPLYLRITVNGKKVEIATGYFIKPADWDSKKHQAKGNSESSVLINNYTTSTRSKILKILDSSTVSGSPIVSAEFIKQKLVGSSMAKKTLLQVFEYHNNEVKEKIGTDYRIGTYKQYMVAFNKLKAFMLNTYKVKDIELESLSYKFITDYEYYLKSVNGLSNNSAMKKIKQLKSVISFALKNDWLNANPFSNFICRYKDPKREALTVKELQSITLKEFSTERLDSIRDIFLFSCYTGLRFSDIQKLSPSNVINETEGKKSLIVDTVKTGDRCRIPLLEPALKLIDKYRCSPECLNKGLLFPVRSNQKTNEYLKEVGEIAGIKKNLHFHLARHTFATTITLSNGVSLESVAEMLGHTNIRTTQIYAKMSNARVSNEMNIVRSKIEVFAC